MYSRSCELLELVDTGRAIPSCMHLVSLEEKCKSVCLPLIHLPALLRTLVLSMCWAYGVLIVEDVTAFAVFVIRVAGILFVGYNDGTVKSFTIKKLENDFELLSNAILWPEDDEIICSCLAWDPKVALFTPNWI